MKTTFPILISIALFTASAVIAQVSNTETAGSSPAAPDTTAAPTVLTEPIAPVTETGIPGPISDGTPAVPTPPKPLPPFKVKSTVVRLLDVVEPPPMTGLPPVTGTITQTVHLVEDPGLPDPPPPLPALPVTDPAVIARMKELGQKYLPSRIAFVSATVYDHSFTYLRCYPNGEARKEICGWSNLDFNHFCGFADFQVKGQDGELRQYALLMGIGDCNTEQRSEWLARMGRTYEAPEHPELPDLATAGPAFVITEGDTTDKVNMDLMQGMHDLYRVEGVRMAAAYKARLIAYKQRKAFLLAHPPKPANVTVLFWARDHPARPTSPVAAPVTATDTAPVATEGGAQ